MVNIDTVYQKVLTLANKEQRGYITPQEYNLLADKAQMEIFDSYFHDLKTAKQKIKNETTHADEIRMIEEKLHPFKTSTSWTQSAYSATASLPGGLYLIDVILIGSTEVTELTKKQIAYTENNPLTKATSTRPVYVRENATFTNNTGNEVITLYPTLSSDATYNIHYYKVPSTPNWTYVVVKGKALHNSSDSTLKNFELHVSEEERLVMRILELAGIVIRSADAMQAGLTDKQYTKQSQND